MNRSFIAATIGVTLTVAGLTVAAGHDPGAGSVAGATIAAPATTDADELVPTSDADPVEQAPSSSAASTTEPSPTTSTATPATPVPAASTSTSIPTTDELYPNPALYVTLDYPSTITIGQPFRITLTCSRPLRDDDLAWVSLEGAEASLKVGQLWLNEAGVEPGVDGDMLVVEWTPTAEFLPAGTYTVVGWCMGYKQPIALTPLPDGVRSPRFRVVVEPATVPVPVPEIPDTH